MHILTVLAVLLIVVPIGIYLLFCLYSLVGKVFGFGVWSARPLRNGDPGAPIKWNYPQPTAALSPAADPVRHRRY